MKFVCMSTEVKIRRMTFFVFYNKNLEFLSTAFSSTILLLLPENRFKLSSLVAFFLKSDEYIITPTLENFLGGPKGNCHYMYICVCVCTYVYIYIYMCVCVCVCIIFQKNQQKLQCTFKLLHVRK